ncbi:MAG: serine/threonine-protein kinase [Myxococcota bacterium]
MTTGTSETLAVAFQRARIESALFGSKSVVQVGRYELIRQLGAGGMGAVYEAHDPKLGRSVAVKVLLRRYTQDPRARQRLKREAAAMAQLSHPQVVQVFEVGEERGESFIARELVDGEPLAAWLDTERSIDAIRRVFGEAARGLAAAHAAGIVHRDFKPHNVLVDTQGGAKVMDFGLASSLGGPATQPPASEPEAKDIAGALTETGAHLGTPQYMSPEQHHGREVGPASDQWSFCVALHEAVHGVLPFAGETTGQVRAAIDDMQIRRGSRDVPSWLDAIIGRGLQPSPAARFAGMVDLAEALRRGPRSRSWLWGLAVVGAVGVAVAIAGRQSEACDGAEARLAGVWDVARKAIVVGTLEAAGGGDVTVTRLAGALDEYAAQWVAVHTGVCEANRDSGSATMPGFDAAMSCLRRGRTSLSSLVDLAGAASGSNASTLLAASSKLPPPERCQDDAFLATQDPLPSDPTERAAYEETVDALTRADMRGVGGDHVGARAALDTLLATLRPAGPSTLLARALSGRGRVADTPQEAAGYLEEAYWMAERLEDWSTAYEAASTLVRAAGGLNRQEDAMRWSRYARAAQERRGLPLGPSLLVNEGLALDAQGNFEEAVTRYQAAIATEEVQADPDSAAHAGIFILLGDALTKLARSDEALRHLRRGYLALREELGPDSSKTAHAEGELGDTLRGVGDFDTALVHHEHALHVMIHHPDLGPDHPRTSEYYKKLARTLAAMGRYEDALGHATRAVEVGKATYGPNHPDVAGKQELLGNILVEIGEFDRALEQLERARATYEVNLPENHPAILQLRHSLASLYLRRDDATRARPILEGLLLAMVELQGPGTARVAKIQFQLAQATWALGEHAPALRLARTSAAAYAKLGDGFDAQASDVAAWLTEHDR